MHVFQKKNGKCWYVSFRYKDNEGNTIQKTISTGVSKKEGKKVALKKAETVVDEFLQEVERCRLEVIHKKNGIYNHKNDTFEEYTEYWLSCMEATVRNNTLIDYKRQINKHINPRIGNIRLSELNQHDIIGFIENELSTCDKLQSEIDRRKKVAQKTGEEVKIQTYERPFYSSIKKHYALIKQILDYAYRDDVVEYNAADRVNKQILKKIPKSNFEIVPYTREEIQTLIDAIKDTTIEAPVMLAACLGLRRSEILGLKWSSIDFAHNIIYIKDTCVLEGTKIVYRTNSTKNDSSKSVLPLPDNLKEYLLVLKEKQAANKKFIGKGYNDTGLVCIYPDGAGIKPGYVSEVFRRILLDNNLREIRFHDLRHTVGTLIYQNTGDIKMTSEILRHSNIKTTADIYVDPDMDYKRRGLETVNVLNLL